MKKHLGSSNIVLTSFAALERAETMNSLHAIRWESLVVDEVRGRACVGDNIRAERRMHK